MGDRCTFQTNWTLNAAFYEANPLSGEQILGVDMIATAPSGTAIHPIDARSDETHLILQTNVLEIGSTCVGDTIGGDKRTQFTCCQSKTALLILLTRPPRTRIPHPS